MFVLVAYKTEPCKRAARLCRQGYACPNYHNSKDRRRSPKNWKYRYNRKTNHRTTPFRVDTARTGHLPGLSRDNTFPVHTKMWHLPRNPPNRLLPVLTIAPFTGQRRVLWSSRTTSGATRPSASTSTTADIATHGPSNSSIQRYVLEQSWNVPRTFLERS